MASFARRKVAHRKASHRRFQPTLEFFERRELLAANVFLQGAAFVDANGNGALDPTDARLPGATIDLYLVNSDQTTTHIGQATTGADGSYLFDDAHNVTNGDLQAGKTYRIVQTPPAGSGYVSSATEVRSQIYNANSVAGASNAIDVAVVDPSELIATYNAVAGVTYTFPADRIETKLLDANGNVIVQHYSTLTQRTYSLSGDGQAPDPNPTPLPTFCVEITTSAGTGTYTPKPISDLPGNLPANYGQIAYLYNHYGTILDQPSRLPAAVQSLPLKARISGMQLAIWTLEYGDRFQIVSHDLTYTSDQDFQNMLAARNAFLTDVNGQSEPGIYLDAVSPTTQGVIATGSYNFANIRPPFQNITISGTKTNDLTGNGASADDTPLSGVEIRLYQETGNLSGFDANDTLVASTSTLADGSFQFPNLGPGTYYVQEVVPPGSIQTAGPAYYTVNAVSGHDATGNDFGNFQLGSISGVKFNDLNGDGVRQDGENGLAGWTIQLLDTNNTVLATTVTGVNGSYTFNNLEAGTYRVREVSQVGWVQRSVNPDDVTITSGSVISTGEDFGNFRNPLIDVEKTTNGPTNVNSIAPDFDNEDAPDGPGVPILTPGSAVTWTYRVANPGTVPFARGDVSLIDDNGTPGDANDDLSVVNGKITFQSELIGNGDTILDPGEVWLYTATGIVNDLTGVYENKVTVNVPGAPSDSDLSHYKNPSPPVCETGSLSGFVYVDTNNNGELDFGEVSIKNVTVTLTGTDKSGQAVSMTTLTDENGSYRFDGLRPGTYKITETQPASYLDGKDALGTLSGSLGNDVLSEIVLNCGQSGINYNFGEQLSTSSPLTSGRTATIGFWNNKNGQRLIKSLNGGEVSTALGNWLGATFPNLYGNLTGQSNTYIAGYFQTLFSVRGQKFEAQVLATALAVYVTDSGKAGTVAQSYGFTVTNPGAGNDTINVGSAGSILGVSNNSILSLSQILDLTNTLVGTGGTLSLLSSTRRNALNSLFDTINNTGDI